MTAFLMHLKVEKTKKKKWAWGHGLERPWGAMWELQLGCRTAARTHYKVGTSKRALGLRWGMAPCTAAACPSAALCRVGRLGLSTYFNHRGRPLQHHLGDHSPVAVLRLVLVTVQVRVTLLLGRAAAQGAAAGPPVLQLQPPTSPSPTHLPPSQNLCGASRYGRG